MMGKYEEEREKREKSETKIHLPTGITIVASLS